ncbi:MAG: hypothetical protein JXA96_18435, partial [Sedimentisphaerales bacterium]|nr:hypothetical protein [Sedimentisphaerales bacterium]
MITCHAEPKVKHLAIEQEATNETYLILVAQILRFTQDDFMKACLLVLGIITLIRTKRGLAAERRH